MWVEQSGGRVGGGWREGRCSSAGVCGKGAAADRTLSVGGGVSERAAVPIAHMPVATGGLFNGTSRSPHGCAYRAPLAVTVARASSAIDLADVGVGALVHVATVERSVAPRELSQSPASTNEACRAFTSFFNPRAKPTPSQTWGRISRQRWENWARTRAASWIRRTRAWAASWIRRTRARGSSWTRRSRSPRGE